VASVRGLHKYECRVIFMTGRSEKRVSCMSSAGVIVSENTCYVHALLNSVHISFTLGCQVFTREIDRMMVFGAFDTLWVDSDVWRNLLSYHLITIHSLF
jgi:hypothetical protein